MQNTIWTKGVVLLILLLFVGVMIPTQKSQESKQTPSETIEYQHVLYTEERLDQNKQPTQPIISGPHYGKNNTAYTFSLGAITDPEGDQIYALWDWGDNSTAEWLGPYNSGETADASHAWSEPGNYTIKVKLKDELGSESNWSDPFIIHIVELKFALFLGTFTTINQTIDLHILESEFFLIFPSDFILVLEETVVISTEAYMGLAPKFIFGMGDITVL